jgi:hypothetical protein
MPPDKRTGPGVTTPQARPDVRVTATALDVPILSASAWRCWAWRHRHGCGCWYPADCLLNGPLPVHEPQPCPGEFTAAGWQPHCRGGAA